ncbi:MAG: proteasome subunit beta [Candidatus Woesearchaeota archaeon]
MEETLKTGTTTLAIKCVDGIVTAADKRATAGSLIVQRDIEKVFPLNERLVVTIAGSVSDIQLLVKYFKAELKINSLRIGRLLTVKEAANLLASYVYSGIRSMGSVTHFLLSGTDEQGYHVYDIFPDGSLSYIHEFVCSGSGSVFAMGLLEGDYQKELTVQQAIPLAKKAMNSALVRDASSGNGAIIYSLSKDGIKKEADITVHTGINFKE